MCDSSSSAYAVSRKVNAFVLILSILTFCAYAGPTEQAKRIHDRIAGVPPSNNVLNQMTTLISNNQAEQAALLAMDNPAFYNVTLKNFASPWTNEAQDVFFPLNDYSATVIGMVRDDVDFREVLYGDIIYVGQGSGLSGYSNTNNTHYETLESGSYDLSDPGTLVQRTQSVVTGLPSNATAGVITTRAAAEAFFSGGTNRAMFRFTLLNQLCTDLEQIKDVSRVPDHVRRDVSRSPGGDSRVFMNNCVGCHAGMDGMTGALSRYEYDQSAGRLLYNQTSGLFDANGVALKYNINATNFKYGYVTIDDSWVNYWRNGQNQLLGWGNPQAMPGITEDEKHNTHGNGAKSLGMELANTRAFSTCQVKKVFKSVCFRDPDNYSADRTQVNLIADQFEAGGYHMKDVFAKVAAYCKGP